MAQSQPVVRATPDVTTMLAALILAIALAVVTLTAGPFSFPASNSPAVVDEPAPALVRAESEWERQRHLQSGYVDPFVQAGRDWQRQREQQSP